MIQRIQSLWLLIASAAALLTLKFSFYSGNKLVDTLKQFVKLNAKENIFLMILTVAVAVAALVVIFLYKDRKMQLKLTLAIFAVSIINIALYFAQIQKFIPNEGNYDLTSLLALAIPILLLLAARAIYKDEKLVKSVDRLR
jgi:amino acid permease